MKAELLKRLFRAIASEDQQAIDSETEPYFSTPPDIRSELVRTTIGGRLR